MQQYSEVDVHSRTERAQNLLGDHQVDDPQGWLKSPRPLIAVVSSRIGNSLEVQRQVCRFLGRSMLHCRDRNGIVLSAIGSAIEPWAIRAAQLFHVDLVRIAVDRTSRKTNDVDSKSPVVPIYHQSDAMNRDEAVIGWADRIDAVHVRRGGRIDKAVRARLRYASDASIRVAIGNQESSRSTNYIALDLVEAGAIGWLGPNESVASLSPTSPALPKHPRFQTRHAWANQSGDWLVHCTRAPMGCWPDETSQQYQDALMLGDASVLERQPIDALLQILRSGRLVASAIATDHDRPVVCLTENSLIDTLSRRCFRPHLKRWDYEPFGVAIRTATARRLGCRPVIYGEPSERERIPDHQRYRFHPVGTTYDWQVEKEWRSPGSLSLEKISSNDLRVFALDAPSSRKKLSHCELPVTWVTCDPGGP